MFNSFNTLIGLIEDNQHDASDYVEKLSDLFRNVLEFRDKDVVSIKEELKLLNDYIYLQKKRFGEKLHFEIQIDPSDLKRSIPPLTLQLLVENAIKHNVISKNKPLSVKLISDKEGIVVKNNVQPKQYAEPSTGFGLESIKSRYSLLSSKPVSINQTDKEFMVQLPLL